MIDMHCHLDLYPSPGKVISEVARRGTYVLAVTTTPKAFRGNLRLAEGHKRIRVAVGLHPELVVDRHHEVDEVCSLMTQTRYVGEIGIDGSGEHARSKALQSEVFFKILKRAEELNGKILSIHSRSAGGTVLDLIEKSVSKSTPILHWFAGSTKDVERANKLGCWFSVGPAMFRSKRSLELISKMATDRILPETDGPFASNGQAPLMPWDAGLAYGSLAELWKCEVDTVHRTLHDNFERLVTARDLPIAPDHG